MKLLFVQGGTRIKRDTKGKMYTDGNFNIRVWQRYMDLSEEKITVVFREDSEIYTEEEASQHLNPFDDTKVNCIILPDMYRPKSNFFSIKKRKMLSKTIEDAVREHDCIIIRSLGNIYVENAVKAARKYNKPYLVEVTGVYWDNSWYHSMAGKALALPRESSAKRDIRKAPYAVYVTEKTLQKRYPCDGVSLGCSDVELKELDPAILEQRQNKISSVKKGSKIILGTAGFLSLRTKGQHDVIKALGALKKKGITDFEYQLIGIGDDSFLRSTAKKYDVEDNVRILGGKTHEEVFRWLDGLDIYVQPSYQEGLCRAIVEAMSRACPVICSDAGGNAELIDEQFIFPRGNVLKLEQLLLKMDKTQMLEQAARNFEKAAKYDKKRLDKIRSDFYEGFVNQNRKK